MSKDYPLSWPSGWPRTQDPKSSSFKTSLAAARDGLMRELSLLGAQDVVISSNLQVSKDGSILTRQPYIEDSGVAVYFTRQGRQQCIPCDKWKLAAENLQAIRLTIEALRGLDRWGAKETVDAAFSGFAALPPGTQVAPDLEWWTELGVSPQATIEEIKDAYRRLAKALHPDAGGDQETYARLQRSYQQALETRKERV